MNQKQLLRPVADAAALAAPLANYNTADAVEFLNTLDLTRAAETLAALPVSDDDLLAGANFPQVVSEAVAQIGDVGAPHGATSIWLS